MMKAQKPAGAAFEVATGRGEAPGRCAAASGSEAASTRQSATAMTRRRVELSIEISFLEGDSAAACMAGRAPVSQEYGVP